MQAALNFCLCHFAPRRQILGGQVISGKEAARSNVGFVDGTLWSVELLGTPTHHRSGYMALGEDNICLSAISFQITAFDLSDAFSYQSAALRDVDHAIAGRICGAEPISKSCAMKRGLLQVY